jgi:hypothetical protein
MDDVTQEHTNYIQAEISISIQIYKFIHINIPLYHNLF